MTRRRAAESDGRLQRTPRYADGPALLPMGLRYRNRSGGRNGLFELSGLHRRTGLRCVLQTIADQASGQSLGGFPSRGSLRRQTAAGCCTDSPLQRGRWPDGSGRRAFAHGIRTMPGMSSLEHGEVDHPDRDVDRPARSSSSAQCREDASVARIHGDRHRHSAREALRCVAPDESHRKKGTVLQEP